jgi:hypothetical protein
MCKVLFLAAVAIVLLLAAGALGQVLHPAAAQHAFAGKAADVYAIENTIDVRALPQVDPLSEAGK